MAKSYSITREVCESMLLDGYICERCGRKPVPIETVDNSGVPTFWAGCKHGRGSGNFTSGVPKHLRDLAYRIVLDDDLYFSKSVYDYIDYGFDYWFEENMAHVCRMLQTVESLKKRKPVKTKTQLRKRFNQAKKWKNR